MKRFRTDNGLGPDKITIAGQCMALGFTLLVVAIAWFLFGCSFRPTIENNDARVADAAAPDIGPLLWSDANLVLASAWCELAQRCDPSGFAFTFGTSGNADTQCVGYEAAQLCFGQWEGEAMCSSVYPLKQVPYLHACPSESAAATCGSAWPDWTSSCNLAAPWSQ